VRGHREASSKPYARCAQAEGAAGRRTSGLAGLAFLCIVGLAAFLGTGASSAADGACPNEAIRVQQHATNLADCRAYEKVSPADKGFGDIVGDGLTTIASASGDAVAFNSRAQFAGAVGSGVSGQTQYVARRGEAGWTTSAITPMPRPESLQTFFAATKAQIFSKDLSTAVVWGYDLPEADLSSPERNNIYVEDTATRALQLVTASQEDPLGFFDFVGEQTVWGLSDDARHMAFTTTTRMLPDAISDGSTPNLYQWDDGVLTLAGVLPDGTVPSGGATVEPANYGTTSYREAMSADGSRLAFRSPAYEFDAQLYLRIDGNRTVWVSQPEGSDQSTPTGVMLQGMTRDGENVFFVTNSPMLDSDTNGGPDLYRYTDSADPAKDSNLTMISEHGDAPGNVAGGALVGFSQDGQRAYYQTTSDEIVLWDHAARRVVAPGVSRAGTPNHQLTVTASKPGFGRVTPDGLYTAFIANDALDYVHGPTGEVTNGFYEMYVYSATDDTLKCASCPAGGATSNVAVQPSVTGGNPTIENVAIRPSFLSDDGRVFFSSREQLVPEDVNDVADTYEYDGATGDLSLLSTGRGTDPAMFADASKSGDDVFILTRQPLVSSDRDELVDLYDVRASGGLPEPALVETPPCQGEDCQPPSSNGPGAATIDSKAVRAGNPRSDCAAIAERAARLSRLAARLRRGADRAAGSQARRLARRSSRLSERADELSRAAKRCRRANRGAGK